MKPILRLLAIPFAVVLYAVVWCVMAVGLLVVGTWVALFGRGRK